MHRRQLLAAVGLTALCAVLLLGPALASVELVSFGAEPTTNNTIMVTWETATERDMIGFKLYRSLTGSGADWVDLIPEGVPADGTAQGGARYGFEDKTDIALNTRYYYQLKEISNTGDVVEIARASTGIGLPADTATSTGTPTASPTWTRVAGSVGGAATATPPRPTATPRYTLAPPTAAPGTPAPRAGTTATVQAAVSTRTPLVGAQVATPTGAAPRVTLPAPASPAVQQPVDTPAPLAPETPTPDLVAMAEGPGAESPTPVPTKDATPVIFSSAEEGTASPTPAGAEQTSGEGAESSTRALVIGGGALGIGALLAALYLFLRSRRG